MTLHAPHLGSVGGFIHTHHLVSAIAAVAVIGGGAAVTATAWHSTQPNQAQTMMHRHQWMAHQRAYDRQVGWLGHHGYQTPGWMHHYRGYQAQVGWMRAHNAWAPHPVPGFAGMQARMVGMYHHWAWNGHQHRYYWQMGWLLNHRAYQNHHWLNRYAAYRHALEWMRTHMAWAPPGHQFGRYRDYESHLAWMRHHWMWTPAQVQSSAWYRRNYTWMHQHMGGSWGNYMGTMMFGPGSGARTGNNTGDWGMMGSGSWR